MIKYSFFHSFSENSTLKHFFQERNIKKEPGVDTPHVIDISPTKISKTRAKTRQRKSTPKKAAGDSEPVGNIDEEEPINSTRLRVTPHRKVASKLLDYSGTVNRHHFPL